MIGSQINIRISTRNSMNNFFYFLNAQRVSLIFSDSRDNNCSFTLSPNPAKSTIILSDIVDSSNNDGDIAIYDISGVLQMKYKRNAAERSVTLDVSHLNAGIYIIKVGDSNKKIIIE